MYKVGNYVLGSWQDGQGDGKILRDASTGEAICTATCDGIDLEKVLEYGREKGRPPCQK